MSVASIAENTPQYINLRARNITCDETADIKGGLTFSDGAADGKVLTSDTDGKASWESVHDVLNIPPTRVLVTDVDSVVTGLNMGVGQFLIGATGNVPTSAILETKNGLQLNYAGAGTITLTNAQDLDTSGSPSFVALNLSAADTKSNLLNTDASGDVKGLDLTAGQLVGGGALGVPTAMTVALANGAQVNFDGDHTMTFTMTQDLKSTGAPTFAGATLSDDLKMTKAGGGVIVSESRSYAIPNALNPATFVLSSRNPITQDTSTSTAVVLDASSGVITCFTSTLAAVTSVQFTLTNAYITSSSVVLVSILNYSGTYATNGFPVVSVQSVGTGSCVICVSNVHAANALSGVLKIGFQVC